MSHRPKQPDLFGAKPARKKRGTPAPEQLTPPEMRRLADWAEVNVPWLSREALESFENLDSYVTEILLYWQGDGGLKARWLQTCMNRIVASERRRLTEIARRTGSADVRAALRDPEAWARGFDIRAQAGEDALKIQAPKHLDPGGGRVIDLVRRSPS